MDILSYEECKILFKDDIDIKYDKYWVKEKVNDKIVIRLAEKDDIDRGNFGLSDEDDLVPAYRIDDFIKWLSDSLMEVLNGKR